jgi:hypothetical protein
MQERALTNPVEQHSPLPEPHFNDQQTVLRAQQVVPLQEIRTKTRHRKMWFLSSAFVVAMLLGAASALLAVRLKQPIVAGAAIEVSEQPDNEDVSTPVTIEQHATAASLATEIGGGEITEPAPPTGQSSTATRRRIAATNHSNSTTPVRKPERSEEDELEKIREAVLFDQWQERRLRRATRRERRRADRDLSHVEEIFEGRRRPERP